MLCHTFLHLKGVGPRTEKALWDNGILGWEQLLDLEPGKGPLRISGALRLQVEESLRRLQAHDPHFFARGLPSQELWRLFREFRHSAAYLDIETTGLWAGQGHVTTIALYDGREIRTYVHRENLWEFAQDIRGYKLLITYNGRCFDLPFIRESMGLCLDQVHIDLRFLLAGLGYRGGLKGCERALGLERGDLEGVDGFFAVLLWEAFLREQEPKFLETLLAYNIQDVLSLEFLMVKAYNMKLAGTPFAEELALCTPEPRISPFSPDPQILDRIRARLRQFAG